MKLKFLVPVSVLLFVLLAAYSVFFLSPLHYGDYSLVRDNSAIRSVLNIPRFFIDSSTSNTEPEQYAYQPTVTTSLAIDYFFGRGGTLFYRLSTFLVFLVALAAIAWLFFVIFERTIPHEWNPYLAVMATALFALHPAVPELLNSLAHRGEFFAAAGVIGGIALYAGLPQKRSLGLYLIPPALGILANPAGLVFGPMLLIYILLIEPAPSYEVDQTLTPEQTKTRDLTQAPAELPASGSGAKRVRIRRRKHPFRRYLKAQLTRFTPALLFTGVACIFESFVNSFQSIGEDMTRYWFTPPWVAVRYFGEFFAPAHLAPASDLAAFNTYHLYAVFGLAFVLAMISAGLILVVSPPWRPVVFGIWWFLVGILPGALLMQPEVESDTRMFLPFIGLALSVAWAARMILPSGVPLRRLEAIAATALLLALAYGTYARNRVWADEETLWRDAVAKHPASVRALENHALVLVSKGRPAEAYENLRNARRLAPESAEVESDMGIAAAALNDIDDTEQHFLRARTLAAGRSYSYFPNAVWLEKQGRRTDALEAYSWAASLAPSDLRPRYGMMRIYDELPDWYNLRKTVQDALSLAPGDPETAGFAVILQHHPDNVKAAEELARKEPTAENYLTLSDSYCADGRYKECMEAAQKAIQLRPQYALAYNNLGAAYVSLGRLDEAIETVKQALKFDPDNHLAQANLAMWQRRKLVVGNAINRAN
jgi:tetratricopeptide (TPR) repeat protein